MEYVLSVIGMPEASLKRAFAPLGNLALHIHDHFIPNARNNYHPHILGHRALALFSALFVALKVFTVVLLAFGPVSPAFSSAITVENIINLTNQSRVQFSETPLNQNAELDAAAQAKANDMLAKGYFAHDTPSGQTPWDFITAAGYSYLEAGENLAVNFTQAEDVETAWMNSPDHRANLLNKNFEDIGIGISEGQWEGHTAIFVVQEFGTPAAQQVTLSDTQTKVQATAVPAPAVKAVSPKPQPTPTQVRGSAPVASASGSPAAASTPSPQTLGADQNQASPPPQVAVQSGNIQLDADNVNITANTSGPATKVIAYFGQQAIMLSPQNNNVWTGQVPVSTLTQANLTVKLEAFGMDGQSNQIQLADFSANTVDNYSLASATTAKYVTFLGYKFDPNAFDNQFYLLFIAVLLTSLVIAIAMKRHVQHVSLIANTAFVVIFATLLWWGG